MLEIYKLILAAQPVLDVIGAIDTLVMIGTGLYKLYRHMRRRK